jgi:hypothetical protein
MFCIATASLSEEDSDAAKAIGGKLYDLLTRDRSDPLSFGPGISVAIDFAIDWKHTDRIADLADHVMLILVAGTDTILLSADASVERLEGLAQTHPRVVKFLATTDQRWQREKKRLGSLRVFDSVVRRGPNGRWMLDAIVDEVLLSLWDVLGAIDDDAHHGKMPSFERPHLFLSPGLASHSGVDGSGGSDSPQASSWGVIDDAHRDADWTRLIATRLGGYFASVSFMDEDLVEQTIRKGTRLAAVLMTTGDLALGQARLHQREVITAIRQGWPVVCFSPSSEALNKQHDVGFRDRLMSSVLSPSDPPGRDQGHFRDALRGAVVEHIRQMHFHVIAGRVIESAELPINTAVLSRSPELVDLHSGLLRDASTRIVLHPDPVLTPESREVLRAAAPLLHPVTPSSLLGRSVKQNASGLLETPLDQVRVGLSVSDVPLKEFRSGQTPWHLEDAAVQITRCLLSGGASISYGGSFRLGNRTSFTSLLAQLIQAYNQTAGNPAKRLEVFQAADSPITSIPEEVFCELRHVGRSDDLRCEAVFEVEEISDLPHGMKYSEMRKVMIANTDARVAVGGNTVAREHGRTDGYGGRFPGIAEEVYRALHADQPVYLCGGFGGITHRLAELMQSPDSIDSYWDDSIYRGNSRLANLTLEFDEHPKRELLKLPANLISLAEAIARFSRYLADDDEMWLDFNGLTRQQNEILWNSIDPILISSLIADGLIVWRARQWESSGKSRIELIHGDVITLTRTDLLALPVFDDVDPQGAGAAIDRVTGGLISQAQQVPGRLIGVRSDQLDVDYVCALSLGEVVDESKSLAGLPLKIRDAASDAVELCITEGFQSLAVVTFGGSTLESYPDAVNAMLDGFRSCPANVVIRWVEYSEERFNELYWIMGNRNDMDVTTVLNPPEVVATKGYPWYSLTVKLHGSKLDITGLPSEGSAKAWSFEATLDQESLDELAAGSGDRGKGTPRENELRAKGREVSKLLFGENASEFWEQYKDSPIAITHNPAAAKIPFELMRFGEERDGNTPVVGAGIHRWLASSGGRISNTFGRPRLSRQLRVGLVIDPDGSLAGARREGQMIAKSLGGMSGKVRVQCLGTGHGPATRDAVSEMLRQVDVLHFCGHARFNASERAKSSLVLANGEKLTTADLEGIAPLPRVMIFNACEAGRVRGVKTSGTNDTFSIAESILRSGVEAFLGTYWEVDDKAAAMFALDVYNGLTGQLSLRESVTEARRNLANANQREWANYILYGDGRFRLA